MEALQKIRNKFTKPQKFSIRNKNTKERLYFSDS